MRGLWLAVIAGLCLPAAAEPLRRPTLMTYYESWLDGGGASALATLPRSVDIVALAFARPDLRYAGDLRLQGTGLQFIRDGVAVRAAVAALRARDPAVRVLLAVGGSGYGGWERLDAAAVARLVRDLRLDGVDLDYEPAAPACTPAPVTCASDRGWVEAIGRLRASLPGALLTAPGWSVGAFGEGRWAGAPPASPWTGSMLRPLGRAGAMLDLVAVMAYGAGPRFDPAQALAAYQAAWPGPVLLGASITDGAGWLVSAKSPAGVMLYGWLGRPPPGQPDAAAVALAWCRAAQPRACE